MTAPKMAAALDYIVRRLQMDVDDGSRPDQWTMEDLIRTARAALPSDNSHVVENGAAPLALTADAVIADLLAALQGVLRVADRATDEFDAARAAIAKAGAKP